MNCPFYLCNVLYIWGFIVCDTESVYRKVWFSRWTTGPLDTTSSYLRKHYLLCHVTAHYQSFFLIISVKICRVGDPSRRLNWVLESPALVRPLLKKLVHDVQSNYFFISLFQRPRENTASQITDIHFTPEILFLISAPYLPLPVTKFKYWKSTMWKCNNDYNPVDSAAFDTVYHVILWQVCQDVFKGLHYYLGDIFQHIQEPSGL